MAVIDVNGRIKTTVGAPTGAKYVVLSYHPGLPYERVLTAGSNIVITDEGANAGVQVAATLPDHTHAADDGGQLDWDEIFSDAVHDHSSDAEGGALIDLDGAADALVLSEDGNDTISAPNDGQIDIEVGGTDRAVVDGEGITVNDRIVEAVWVDYPLYDTANALGITSHWRDNDGSYPDGWTELDAANDANTNDVYSFWTLKGSNVETSWDYRRQNSMDLETVADWVSVQIGPCMLRDGDFAADIDYYFGVYPDDGGIDTTIYSRVHLWWDSANSLWKIRGEEHDGSTGHDSSWVTLDQDPLQPFYMRAAVTGAAGKTTRQYYGASYITNTQTLLQSQAPSSAPTWGQFWVRLHQSRGAGVSDALIIGSIDYIASA